MVESPLISSENVIPAFKKKSWVRGKFSRFFAVSLLFYIGGFLYLNTVLQENNVMMTYMSEPSLMPGYVKEKFNKAGLANELAFQLKNEKKSSSKSALICDALVNRIGLPCYKQNWTSNIAFQSASGTNLYTVVRAKRSNGVEAMLFAVDFADHPRAAAMLLAFALYAKDQIYWYRDIFIVFIDGGAAGMDAFLQEYHLVHGNGIRGEPLQTTGGFLIGGIACKDWGYDPNEKNEPFSVQFNHMNGQQVNLDLVNVVVKIGSRLLGSTPHIYAANLTRFDFHGQWFIVYRAMWTQAFVPIEGLHSVMGKYRVEGVTAIFPPWEADLTKYVKLLEGVARSLNVAHERLHQSYFMYVMLSAHQFISIAYFYPAIVIFIMPLLIFIMYEYLHTMCLTYQVPPTFCFYHAYSLAVWIGSYWYFDNLASPVTLARDSLVLLVLISVPVGLIIRPHLDELQSMRVYVLTETALLAASLALTNFSLSLVFSVLATPVVYVATIRMYETMNRKLFHILRLVRTLLVLAVHPLVLCVTVSQLGVSHFGQTPYLPKIDFQQLPSVMSSLVSLQMLYGSNQLPLLLIFIIPIWNAALAVASAQTLQKEEEPIVNVEEKQQEEAGAKLSDEASSLLKSTAKNRENKKDAHKKND